MFNAIPILPGAHVSNKTDEEFYNVEVRAGLIFRVLKRYKIEKIIDNNGFVCSAYDEILKQNVAIKKLTYNHMKHSKLEFGIMNSVNHINVIRLLNAFTPQKSVDEFVHVYLVMELMEANLSQTIYQSELNHDQISYLLYQILCGIKYLHSDGIIHRDLKPSNIVVKSDCTLKILDFGFACITGTKIELSEYYEHYYQSPEIILNMDFCQKADIWSVGCIFGEMLRKTIIFKSGNIIDQWSKIIKQLGTPSDEFINRLIPSVRNYVSSIPQYPGLKFETLFPDMLFPADDSQLTAASARDLLSKMLVIDPLYRISVDEALNHPYINLWYDDLEVNVPVPNLYDHSVNEQEHIFDEWKQIIFDQVTKYEQQATLKTIELIKQNYMQQKQ